jgi:hypothetical protein
MASQVSYDLPRLRTIEARLDSEARRSPDNLELRAEVGSLQNTISILEKIEQMDAAWEYVRRFYIR